MALDRARLKQRLSAALIKERTQRGNGDARRFPQPKMAELLGYSLRQYQRLEDPNDGNLPSWDSLETILDKLGLSSDDIFGGDDATDVTTPPTPLLPGEGGVAAAEVHELLDEVRQVHAELGQLRDEVRQVRDALREAREG